MGHILYALPRLTHASYVPSLLKICKDHFYTLSLDLSSHNGTPEVSAPVRNADDTGIVGAFKTSGMLCYAAGLLDESTAAIFCPHQSLRYVTKKLEEHSLFGTSIPELKVLPL